MPDGVNPKDLTGEKKVSFTKLPAIGLLHTARAMMDGARKYGPYNWREGPVQAHVYVDAAKRHLNAWFEGEENAKDSGVHHLGHAAACCLILLDAQAYDCLADTRPKIPEGMENVFAALLEEFTQKDAPVPLAAGDMPVESHEGSSMPQVGRPLVDLRTKGTQ